MIQSTSRCLGLLGSGISHSLSPLIHNYAAARLGVDAVYLCFDSAARQFPGSDFFQAMWDMGAFGFNVTVPFKEDAARMFPGSGLSSVNTIYRGEKGWKATSTDAEGFLLGLEQLNRGLEDHEAFVFLGNGGAALALYEHFLKVSQRPLIVLRRTAERDAQWKKPAGRVEFHDLNASTLDAVCRRFPQSLLLQTTSAPLHGDRLDHLLPGLKAFQGTFVDLVYGKTSALLDELRTRGLPVQDGLPMLIGQALLGQKLWWGKSADFADVESMLRGRSP
jgi:shikimate dehydrogenase